MSSLRKSTYTAVLVTLAILPLSAAFAHTLHVVDDTYVRSDELDKSKGDKDDIKITNATLGNHEQFGFAKFDLSSLPISLTSDDIENATLRFWVRNISGDQSSITLCRVSTDWSEASLPTINPTADCNAVIETVPIFKEDENSFVVVPITNEVKYWLDNPNFGLAMTTSGMTVHLASKEYNDAGNAMHIELGIRGSSGATGPQGPAGADGQDGADGAPGLPGADGQDGADGAPGLPGADGQDGADGAPGLPGADGQDGADGAPGLPGADGQDGADGADGADGTMIAAQTCPSDQNMVGIDASGNLICESPYRYIFSTSTRYAGHNFGGLSGADTICNDLAVTAGLPGTYVAWLSDDTTSANDRMSKKGIFVSTQDYILALSYDGLTDGRLASSIVFFEDGTWAPTSPSLREAWTGTLSDGSSAGTGQNCGNWAVSGEGGRTGYIATTTSWTQGVVSACTTARRLYCVQQ